MNDEIRIPEYMLDDFESSWRRRRRLAGEAVGPMAWMMLFCSVALLAFAVALLFDGNEVGGLTVLACVPMPSLAFGIVYLVVRKDARKADGVLRMIDNIRRRGPTTGGCP